MPPLPATEARGLVGLLDVSSDSLYKLGSMGGFGYLVYVSGVVSLITSIILRLMDLISYVVICILIAGFIFSVVERIMAYKIANLKLNMIMSLTEKLLLKTIPDEGKADPRIVQDAINEVFSVIWGMDFEKPPKQLEAENKPCHGNAKL